MINPKQLFARKTDSFPGVTIISGQKPVYSHYSIDLKKKLLRIDGGVFENCHFNDKSMSQITFNRCMFIGCTFFGTVFQDVEFHKCNLENCLFYKTKFDQVYLDPESLIFNKNWLREAPNVNVHLFQSLYRNFKSSFQDSFAEYCDKKFKFYRRWYEITRKKKTLKDRFQSNWYVVKDVLYYWCTGYGYNVSNALFSTFVMSTILITGLHFFWEQFEITSNVSNWAGNKSIAEKIYFFFATSTTLGYGDFSPKSVAGMVAVVILLFCSVLWTATVTAILVKRISR